MYLPKGYIPVGYLPKGFLPDASVVYNEIASGGVLANGSTQVRTTFNVSSSPAGLLGAGGAGGTATYYAIGSAGILAASSADAKIIFTPNMLPSGVNGGSSALVVLRITLVTSIDGPLAGGTGIAGSQIYTINVIP